MESGTWLQSEHPRGRVLAYDLVVAVVLVPMTTVALVLLGFPRQSAVSSGLGFAGAWLVFAIVRFGVRMHRERNNR